VAVSERFDFQNVMLPKILLHKKEKLGLSARSHEHVTGVTIWRLFALCYGLLELY
jgi:hypothetical protein